jgi:hypothetical protein
VNLCCDHFDKNALTDQIGVRKERLYATDK